MNALDLLKAREGPPFISFGCPLLADKAIGGVPFQGITELSGEAGCGKTQFCLSLALQVQLDALHGGRSGASAYLSCGEGTFPIRRLSQLASAYQQRTGIQSQEFLRNVHIEHCYNIEDTQSILRHKIPELCQKQNVKLLIIDSLAGLVRFEFDSSSTSDMRIRTVLLFQLAKELKLLSDIFKLSIVVVNQVKADMDEFTSNTSSSPHLLGDSASMPALGMAWSYCVNAKISLHRNSAALRVVSTVVDDHNDGSDEEEMGRLLGSTDEPNMNQSGGGGGGGAGAVGQKRSIHDTVYSSHHYGKNAEFYDTAAESAGKHTAEPILHTTNLISNTIYTSTASVTSNDPSTKKENTSSNKLTNTYVSNNILPKLHDYITYYPTQLNNSANSADNNAYVPTDVHLSGKSTRYIRLDSSVHKARDSCRYEISHVGVFGVDG
eukprot:gene9253-10910_t